MLSDLFYFSQPSYVFMLIVFDFLLLWLAGSGEGDFVENEVAFEDLAHYCLETLAWGAEKLVDCCLAKDLEILDLDYFSEFAENEGVLFGGSGVCFKGNDHFEEDVHKIDNFKALFLALFRDFSLLADLLHFEETVFSEFSD